MKYNSFDFSVGKGGRSGVWTIIFWIAILSAGIWLLTMFVDRIANRGKEGTEDLEEKLKDLS